MTEGTAAVSGWIAEGKTEGEINKQVSKGIHRGHLISPHTKEGEIRVVTFLREHSVGHIRKRVFGRAQR